MFAANSLLGAQNLMLEIEVLFGDALCLATVVFHSREEFMIVLGWLKNSARVRVEPDFLVKSTGEFNFIDL